MAATYQLHATPPLAAVLGTATTTRTAAVRGIWAYIREHRLQRGKYIELDKLLRPLASTLKPRTLKRGDPLLRPNQCHFLGIASLVANHVEKSPPCAGPAHSDPSAASVVPLPPHVL